MRVIGVEAEASQALSRSVTAGRVVPVEVLPTLADGLAGNLESGSITVELARRHVSSFVTVTEAEIAEAMRFLHAEHGLVAEGAGAAAVAAFLARQARAARRAARLRRQRPQHRRGDRSRRSS